ncbi:MAG: PQQ-binding-like beta-propeller repeat protein, partial [Thermoguttaceae bacterium]
MKRIVAGLIFSVAAVVLLGWLGRAIGGEPQQKAAPPAAQEKELSPPVEKANNGSPNAPANSAGPPVQTLLTKQRGPAPSVAAPAAYASEDGKVKGWKVVIPGNRPLATPAVVGGKLFIGGGFGSYEFYAFDAKTGKLLWQYRTADDGPTAAVVDDGCVAFNTESCELEMLTTDGKPIWKKWLGDPLMSMPAIAGGRLLMAFPDSRGDREHRLACFELRTGKELWRQKIAGEIIT